MLALYKHMLALRRANPALVSGRFSELSVSEAVVRFVRSDGEERFEVLLNFGEQVRRMPAQEGTVVACTVPHRIGEVVSDGVYLEPAEALIIKVAR
jgi:alpha-glucosidase